MSAQQQARRLKTREQFQAVLACAPVARTEHFVMHRMDLSMADTDTVSVPARLFADAPFWFGAMVPKRWARRAVTRNLIKRQIYSLAAQPAALPTAAYLVRLRGGFEPARFPSAASAALRAAVRAELQQLYARAARAAKGAA
jgi:ribonuclease P protein component